MNNIGPPGRDVSIKISGSFVFGLRSTATTQAAWRLWMRMEFHWKLLVSIPRMQRFIFGLSVCYGVILFVPTFGWVTLFSDARELAKIVTLADPKWVHEFCSANLWAIGVSSRTSKLRVGQVTSVAGPILRGENFSSNLWIRKLYFAMSVWFWAFWNYFEKCNPTGDLEILIDALINLLRFLHSCFCFCNSKELTNPHFLNNQMIPETDMLFVCWNSQSFHFPTVGFPRFTTQAMLWTGSSCTFIVHGPWTGSQTVQIWL